ncbi:MAG: hypothetical protein KBF64_00995 [Anaerolineaceae bacterium]|nr:hypothetical protein [Anaerolineaceae bacterium]
MIRKSTLNAFLSVVAVVFLSGCTVVESFQPTATETPSPTSTPTPPPPTPTPTATKIPYYAEATVFSGDLQVPILIYHRFIPDFDGETTSMKMQYSEFKRELQTLYDAGFSLISLKSWIDGTFIVPEGRKPLIITMDDAWFADQIYINEDGTPSAYSAIGILWRFANEHPEFGFHAALFAIMGDKYYGDVFLPNYQRFIVSEGTAWKDKLGNTMVWALENGIEVGNHTFLHPRLSEIKNNADIQYQLSQNDLYARTFLERVGRSDLSEKMDNIIALPEGIWPATQSGRNVILNYINPEGKLVMAVMEAYNMDAVQFTPSYFSAGFNPYAIPRITASPFFVNYIVENKDLIPTALTCELGPMDEEKANDQSTLSDAIKNAIASGLCSEGVYHVNGFIFFIKDGNLTLHSAPMEEASISESTETPLP